MIVFYSWQTDSPRKTNKAFIQGALDDAIAELNAEVEITQPERPDSPIELDQDTKGILGSPPIAEVILSKIKAANVVVSDVTLVATGCDDKLHINSNVAIELGYALGAKGYEPLLKVMNTYAGDPNQLPFDLRDRRHPVTYKLAPDASKATIRQERTRLAHELVNILRQYLSASEVEPQPLQRPHTPVQSTFVGTAFWTKNEPIGREYRGTRSLYCETDRLVSMRFIPDFKQDELSTLDCQNAVENFGPPLGGSFSTSTNEWGAMSYCVARGSQSVLDGVQVFRSREVWMFASDIIWQSRADDADNGEYFVSHDTIMKYLPNAIGNGIALAERLFSNGGRIVLTAASLKGVNVHTGKMSMPDKSQIMVNRASVEALITDNVEPNALAFEFAKKIYAEAGVSLEPRIRGDSHT